MTTNGKMVIRYDGEGGASNGGAGAPNLLGGATPAGGAQGGTTPGEAFKLPDNWDYRTALPEDLKGSPSAAKYGSLADLVRGFDNAQQLIGKPTDRLLELPETIDDKALGSVMKRLGLPDKLDDYKISAPKGSEAVLKIDSPNFKALSEAAHAAGILPGQFQKVLDVFGGQLAKGQNDMMAAEVARHEQNVTKLKEQWGEAFDSKVAAANLAVEKLGGDKAGIDALRESINRGGLGTDGPLLAALAKIGEMFSEDEGGGDKGGISAPMTPDTAKAEGMRLLQEAINAKTPAERARLNEEAQKFFDKASRRAK